MESVPRELMIEKMYALGIDGRELERDMESVRRFLPRARPRRPRGACRRSSRPATDVVRDELDARGILRSNESQAKEEHA